MSLAPVPAEPAAATCANCGAELVADQRYCLSCGQPVSPTRLSFLDVLASEPAPAPAWGRPAGVDTSAFGYLPVIEQSGSGWLRRYSGVFSLLAVLVGCLIAGLLVGHWATQGKASTGPQIVKIEGLAAAPAASAGAATSTTSSSTGTASKSSEAKEEQEAAKEAAKETKAEKAPPAPPKKVEQSTLNKLTTSTGKKHTEEINALGAQPIETG